MGEFFVRRPIFAIVIFIIIVIVGLVAMGSLPIAQYPDITPPEISDLATAARISRVIIKHLVIEDITGDLGAAGRMGEQIARRFPGEVLVG